MPLLRSGVRRGRAKQQKDVLCPIEPEGEAIATRTRRRSKAAAAVEVLPNINEKRLQEGSNQQPPPVNDTVAAAVANPEEHRVPKGGFEFGVGEVGGAAGGAKKEEIGDKKMDDHDSGAGSNDKAHAVEEEGSTAPLPEKVSRTQLQQSIKIRTITSFAACIDLHIS